LQGIHVRSLEFCLNQSTSKLLGANRKFSQVTRRETRFLSLGIEHLQFSDQLRETQLLLLLAQVRSGRGNRIAFWLAQGIKRQLSQSGLQTL
jgi:hypothetical protein